MHTHMEAYLDSYDGYGGQGTLLSKFGIEEQDDSDISCIKRKI